MKFSRFLFIGRYLLSFLLAAGPGSGSMASSTSNAGHRPGGLCAEGRFFGPMLSADTVPKPIGYVNDFEKLFTEAERRLMDSTIGMFERRTTMQIAVVTIDSSMTGKEDFDNFTLRILRVWGVGQAGKNNGIVIGISRAYRRIRIQNGYGIEKVLSNAETKVIIDTAFIPLFKKGQYFEGTLNGLQALIRRLE